MTEVIKAGVTISGGTAVKLDISGGVKQAPPAVRNDPNSYNVVEIVIDDMGPEWFEFYNYALGNAYAYTPRLAALVADGVLFTRAHAQPICGPTRSAIQTGKYAFRTGFGTNITVAAPYHLDNDFVFLPEAILEGRGVGVYQTGAFGKWHLCEVAGNDSHPKINGYKRFSGHMPNAASYIVGGDYDHYIWNKVISTTAPTPVRTQIGTPAEAFSVVGNANGTTYTTNGKANWNGTHAAADAVAWMNSVNKPFYAYVCFNPPHAPYQVPPLDYLSAGTISELASHGFTQQGQIADETTDVAGARVCFRAAMEAVDNRIGYILDNLNPEKLSKTVFIIHGDNGTASDVVQEPFTPSHAKRSAYQQGTMVPFIVYGPIVAAPGRTCDHLVHTVDVWATVMDICLGDRSLVDAGTIDSRSFYNVLVDPDATPGRDNIFLHTFRPNGTFVVGGMSSDLRAVHDGVWKYIFIEASGNVVEEFYKIDEDPWESTNLMALGYNKMTSEQKSNFDRLRLLMTQIITS